MLDLVYLSCYINSRTQTLVSNNYFNLTYNEVYTMGVSLNKGGNVSLSKEAPGLSAITIGLGWDERSTTGADFDLDASAFLVNAAGKVAEDKDFIFYNNLTSLCESVKHTGDNLTGDGDGDDESLIVQLESVPAGVEKVVVATTIHDYVARAQNFGMVQNAFIRIVDNRNGTELVRYDLTEDFSTETAMLMGELYRNNGEWKFRAVGQGYEGGLAAMATDHGVSVA